MQCNDLHDAGILDDNDDESRHDDEYGKSS